MTPRRTHASAGFRRQAKTRPGALRCGMCEPGCGRLCMCVKKKKKVFELVHNSPSHLIIPVTFLCSFLLSSLSSPLLSCFQASGPAAALLKVNVFFFFCFFVFLYAWILLIEFDPCSLVQCSFLKLSSVPCQFWSFFLFCPLMDLLGLRDQALQALDLLCAVEVREGWGVSVGEVLGRVGGEGEMERIMEGGSLHARLLQRKLLSLLSGSIQDLLLHLKWQPLLRLDELTDCSPVCTQNKLDCYRLSPQSISPLSKASICKVMPCCNWLLFSPCKCRHCHRNLQDLLESDSHPLQLSTCHQQYKQLSVLHRSAVLPPHIITVHSTGQRYGWWSRFKCKKCDMFLKMMLHCSRWDFLYSHL